jgi:hypothetical protein
MYNLIHFGLIGFNWFLKDINIVKPFQHGRCGDSRNGNHLRQGQTGGAGSDIEKLG